MLRSSQLVFPFVVLASSLLCGAGVESSLTPELWKEYGLVEQSTQVQGKLTATTYRMKDLTGALAAWQSMRLPGSRSCDLAIFCSEDPGRVLVQDGNYVLEFRGIRPTKEQVGASVASLAHKHDSSLPAILTFLPAQGRVANSGRYLLGPVSLRSFAAPLVNAKPGFEQGAEAQVAEYKVGPGAPVPLAVFYYPTPEMARLHAVDFKSSVGPNVKRSGVLVAMVFGNASETEAETLLSRVEYEAKITWNEMPPPSPIRPLYELLANILYISGLVSALCLASGLVYAGMRIYRRRYGTLESDEAMTTLGLRGK
jgi:hypothetical protein